MKLEKILVASKQDMINTIDNSITILKEKAIISISSYPAEELYFRGLERRGLILKLSFLDMDNATNFESSSQSVSGVISRVSVCRTLTNDKRLFSKKQSDLVIQFVNNIKDRVDTLM